MLLRHVAVGVAGAWVAYAWGAHLVAPAYAWRGSRDRRRIALTFDDGPDPTWTPRVLDVLAGRRVRATFFLVGERAARAPDTARRIAAEGHEIASHAWSHRSLWRLGPRATEREIGRTHELLTGLAGHAPRHFRPPWGMVNAALFGALRRHGERLVLWSVQPEGLRPVPAQRQVRHVLTSAHPGAIVDLHDAEGTPAAPARLLAALPAMIDGLAAAGYELARVADVLDEGAAQRPAAAPASGGSLT